MRINGRTFTLGADPEVFLKKREETKNFFWCAEGVIPGTKAEPFKVKRGAIQVDGFAAEFNIDPVETLQGWRAKIKGVLGELAKRVRKQGFDIYCTPVAYFDEKHYEAQSDFSKMLGCDPDYSAITGKMNTPPTPPKDEFFRTGSGHIHIGWADGLTFDADHKDACEHLVLHMDQCIGKPLQKAYPEYKRSQLYGDFGAYRWKPFGVEYRTASNIWLNHPDLVDWVYHNSRKAIEMAMKTTNYDYNVTPCPDFEELRLLEA